MTFADLALDAYFFLGTEHGGQLMKKIDALGYAFFNALVLSTWTLVKIDPSLLVTPMLTIEGTP